MSTDQLDGQVIEPLELPERPLSARNLADWRECPQKLLLSYFVPRAETRRFIGGPAALHQALREALVECYRLGGPEQVPVERLLAGFGAAWDGSLCADSLQEEQLHTQGLEMLETYHARHQQDQPEVIQADTRLEVELGGHTFVAVADVILREADGGLNALRWLSTRRPPAAAEMVESLSWGLLFIAARDTFRDEDVSVTMYSLRRASGHRLRFDAEEAHALQRRATRIADRIRVATEFPTVTGEHCRWCRARGRCPALR
jgi:hypothetical protein